MTKMKTKTLLYMALAAVMTTLAACSQDDDLQQDAAPKATPIEFEITDGGYGGDEATRAVEEGYRTKFTAGDECGLYIVDGSTLEAKNVKLTASEESGKLTWKAADGAISDVDASCKYFLYYPYQESVTENTNVGNTAAEEDGDFFASLISSWVVKPDQKVNKGYTLSDLMTAKGTLTDDGGTKRLSFKLDHRMALAEIAAPVAVDFSAGNYTPCEMGETEDGKFHYRVIINPENVANDGGKNIKGQIGSKTFTIGSAKLRELKRGKYKTFKVGSSYYVDNDGVYHVYDDKGLRAWAAATKTDLSTSCTLENDITMPTDGENATNNWTPVGTTFNAFTGVFNGNGHTIYNLNISKNSSAIMIGFITILGSTEKSGEIKNLKLYSANVTGGFIVGCLVGSIDNGSISYCGVSGDSKVKGYQNVGGVVGETSVNASDAKITACYFSGTAETSKQNGVIGGVCGNMGNGTMLACYSNCTFTFNGTPQYAGGVMAQLQSGASTACYWAATGVTTGIGQLESGMTDTTVNVDGTDGKTWADAVKGMNSALTNAGYSDYKYEIPAGETLPILVKN
ncbi:MAG: hypothetical protein J6C05_02925 [Prevotella sp.]|nr:hypothetical protein [Prevotella sp.]